MALNYAEIIDKARRTQPEHAANVGARAPVFYESPKRAAKAKARTRNVKKRAKLTTTKSQASLTKARVTGTHTGRRRKNPPGAPTMAKKKSGRLSKAEIKKAGGIKQAWAARKRGKRPKTHTKTPRRAAKRSSAPKKARKSSKRRAKRRPLRRAVAIRVPPSRKTKSGRRMRRSVQIVVKGGKRKRSRKLRLPRKTRQVYVIAAERRRRLRRHTAAETPRRRRHHRAAERRTHRRRGAMENPLTGTEIFVGGFFGLVGFGVGDVVDRLIATHSLTVKSAATTTTPALYADTPPTSGSYTGLFNPTAITAPMDWKRWLNAVGAPGVILLLSPYLKSPTARSAVQFAAFGYGFRTVGKGLIDLVAKVAGGTQLGQRFYDGELRAQVLAANNGNQQAAALGNLPAAGLGNPGCACGGKCGKCKPGVGWPSMPRELPASAPPPAQQPQMQQSQPQTRLAPPAPPPAAIPAAPPPAPPGASTSGLTGTPRRSSGAYGGYEH